MKLDDLKQDWQENLIRNSQHTDLTEVVTMLAKETKKIDSEIKRRDILEISIAILLIPAWVYGLFNSVSSMQTLGLCLAIISCLYIPYKLLKAKRLTIDKSSDIKSFLKTEHQKIKQQKQLLETIAWWYIAPLTISIVLITLGARVTETGLAPLNSQMFVYYACLSLLVVGIYFLNKRAAKKKFTPLLKKLEQRLAELES